MSARPTTLPPAACCAASSLSDALRLVGTSTGRILNGESRPPCWCSRNLKTAKTWATERSNFPRELVETALAHMLDDKTEAAYQRGDMLEKRRRLMDAWTEFCTKRASAGAVVSLRRA